MLELGVIIAFEPNKKTNKVHVGGRPFLAEPPLLILLFYLLSRRKRNF
jgi:hypothetical protein